MISQPHSALARTERYIARALEALRSGNTSMAAEHLEHALGAVTFAGNSQSKLIDSTKHLLTFYAANGALDKAHQDAAIAAVKHAESPGID